MTEKNRDKLINILRKQGDQFISGQVLSRELNISRTAVWKHINELKNDGYQFESIPNKGYRLIDQPVHMNESSLKWGLNTKWLGNELIFKEQITSTQDTAHELARREAKHGTIVIAERQLQGRGRMERRWNSNHNGGIWLSMILRPPFPPHQASQITLLAAVVLVDVLRRITDLPIQIKWPNDLYIQNKKISGILTEMQAELEVIQYLIIGFGINVNQSADEFPKELQAKTGSLKMFTHKEWNRQDIIQEILQHFEVVYEEYLQEGFPVIQSKWLKYAYKLNENIQITTHQKQFTASIKGITNDGALLVQRENGKEEIIYSAEINW